MSYTFIVRPAAEQDLADARRWYNDKWDGLGDEFLAVVETTFAHILAMPEGYAVERWNVRLCKMKRFPYVISYRIAGDRIEVLSVLHGKRDPRAWQRRV